MYAIRVCQIKRGDRRIRGKENQRLAVFSSYIAPGFSIVRCIPEVNSLHIVRALKREIFPDSIAKGSYRLFLDFPRALCTTSIHEGDSLKGHI